jgi:hypothetical protein
MVVQCGMKTWLAGVVMFAALSAAAHAEIVAGTVVDRSSNQPAPNVNVTVTLVSGARPLQTKTDAAGRFTVETNETPVNVTLHGARFETYTMQLVALAPSVLADLHIGLNTRLVTISIDRVRSACRAFQPYQPWDVYVLVRGSCGEPKF